ncbi:MAG: PfkB family carbohydrate kinase [Bacteroidota bacterium]
MNTQNRRFDLLAVGELLVDFISTDFAASLKTTENFRRLPGGSPANLAMNMARLGNRSKLVASVGQDDMGQFLKEYVEELNVDCQHLYSTPHLTTLILITRTQQTANFEAYRGADFHISSEQLSLDLLQQVKVFHTTCFALSQPPARDNIFQAAQMAHKANCQLSIDANYSKKIGPDPITALYILQQYVQHGAIVKISDVDWERLFQRPLYQPESILSHFLRLGAKEVVLTLGEKGSWVANAKEKHFLPARKVPVKDTTGAGDAFWSGYLTAFLDGYPLLNRAKAGRRMAELKIGHVGPLPKTVNREVIYEDF